MALRFLPSVLLLLASLTHANITPAITPTPTPPIATFSYSNTSSTISSSRSAVTDNCCFVVQDTVSEEWWQITSLGYAEVNVTSVTTYITKYPNVTSTRLVTSIQTTNRTFSKLWGQNPITMFDNDGGKLAETTKVHSGSEPLITGGVTVPSPAAFYVYNSVKIITVAAITDADGNLQCGTTTSFGTDNVFTNINSNAQAYFHGSSIDGHSSSATATRTVTYTQVIPEPVVYTDGTNGTVDRTVTNMSPVTDYSTFFTDIAGSSISNSKKPTGTVISLITPFVWLPKRGSIGAKGLALGGCDDGKGSENFGYLPQTLLEMLVSNQQYSAQYPGLKNCLPGGPSILPLAPACNHFESTQVPLGGDLTESITIYVTPPGISKPTPKPEQPVPIKPEDPPKKPEEPPKKPDDPPKKPEDSKTPGKTPDEHAAGKPETGGEKPGEPAKTPPTGEPPNTPPATPPKKDDSLGGLIWQIMNGKPSPVAPANGGNVLASGNPIIIPAATQIPVENAPPGLTGEIKTVNGKPVYIVPGPTTIPAPPVLPPGAGNVGSKTVIGGSSYVVISGPTNIPLAEAPAGFKGATTVIGGSSYLVVSGPVTYAAPQAGNGVGSVGTPTTIGGVPYVVISGPTNIPLANAPSGLSGTTTTIDGVPYLVVPSATAIPAPAGPDSVGRTTLIDGTPFVVISGPTSIPLANAPTDLVKGGAKTTMVNGTPYLVVPSQTTVALSPSKTGELSGQLTVIIDGSSRLVIAGPTTIPVNSKFSISGSTTVISGTTKVIVTAPTTVAAKTSATTSSATTSSESETQTQSVVPTPAGKEAPPSSGGDRMMELNACAAALIFGGLVFTLLA